MFEKRMPFLIGIIILVLIIAPYVYAAQMSNAEFVFGGFLINPADGHSYLAKMQQGLNGGIRFVLPYTAEPGDGAFLFLFYLGLGWLSKILDLSLIFTFHSFRILGAIFLLFVLYKFNNQLFSEKRYQNIGFAVCALGSGLGWIAVLFGLFTSDFWVAEAYPFLSMYTNPHFSIGLALMIIVLMPERKTTLLTDLALGIGLGIIQPFSVVIVIVVKIALIGIEFYENEFRLERFFKDTRFLSTIGFVLGGGLILLYQYWSILADPVLSLWNAQNITESPDYLDLFLSLTPSLIMAAFGIKQAWKDNQGKYLVIWAMASLVLVIIPWNLQRRFLTGIYVPLAGLAVYGINNLERTRRLAFRFGMIAFLVLIIPTNIIVLASGVQAAFQQNPKIFKEKEIYDGLEWISLNASPDDLILADEDTGLVIPSATGRRVIYGHPFETVNAEMEREFLEEFIYVDQEEIFYTNSVAERGVDYIFLEGEVSESLDRWINSNELRLGYENDLVRIYQVGR